MVRCVIAAAHRGVRSGDQFLDLGQDLSQAAVRTPRLELHTGRAVGAIAVVRPARDPCRRHTSVTASLVPVRRGQHLDPHLQQSGHPQRHGQRSSPPAGRTCHPSPGTDSSPMRPGRTGPRIPKGDAFSADPRGPGSAALGGANLRAKRWPRYDLIPARRLNGRRGRAAIAMLRAAASRAHLAPVSMH
jgi:hypothetical protein